MHGRPQVIIAVALWGFVVVLGLLFGGEQIPPCLALDAAVVARCQADWHAAQPPPPLDILDPTMPWAWLLLFLVGVSVIAGVAVVPGRRSRR